MRVKYKLNVTEWVNQLGSCGVEGHRLCKLMLFGPKYYTVRSNLGNKFTTVTKKFFFINQPMNLLHMFQLLALTRPSTFKLG